MKRTKGLFSSFMFLTFTFFLILILVLSPEFVFAKKTKASWLHDLPGLPGRAYLSKDIYLHSSSDYDGVNVSSHITKLIATQNTWVDLPAKSTFSVYNVDTTTGTWISDLLTLNRSDFTQPGVPRSLRVTFSSGPAMYCYATVALEGYNARNELVWETVTSTSGAFTETSNAYGLLVGATVTMVDNNISSLEFDIGTADKIGATGKINDFFNASEDYVQQSTATYTIDRTYSTIAPNTTPNGAVDFRWIYIIDSEAKPIE